MIQILIVVSILLQTNSRFRKAQQQNVHYTHALFSLLKTRDDRYLSTHQTANTFKLHIIHKL